MLTEAHRQQLDGIVHQMTTNNEPDENIQAVVNDFKSKYDTTGSVFDVAPETSPTGHIRPEGITNQDIANYAQNRIPIKTPSVGRAFLGEFPKELARQTVGLGAKTVLSLGELPETFARGRATQRTYNVPLIGPTKSIQSEAETAAGNIIEGKQGLGAIAGPLSEAVLGPIDVALGVKGAIGIGKKAASALSARRASQAFESALNLTTPVLSKAEEEAATAQGRKTISKFLGKVTLEPQARDLERAAVAQEAGIGKSTNAVDNIEKARNAIARFANKLRAGLVEHNAIYNTAELRSALNAAKENSSVLFAGDTSLENGYDRVVNGFLKTIQDKPKNLTGLLDARKEFDALVDSKFKGVFSGTGTDNVTKNAILDVRRAANDFIASKLPAGSEFRDLLRKQNLLFEARDNLAARAPRIGTTKLIRFIKSHPSVSRFGKYAVAGVIGEEAARRAFSK